MKKIIMIMLFLQTAMHFLKAQEVTSTLTQITTDLIQGENRNGFNWRTITYQPIYNNAYARGGNTDELICVCKQGMSDGDCRQWIIECLRAGGHFPKEKEVDIKIAEVPIGGGLIGSGGIPWNPSNGSGVDNPPPPPPTDPGGGGNYDPNDPNNQTSNNGNDPDKDPIGPNKPTVGLDEDDEVILPPPPTKEPQKEPCNDTLSSKTAVYLTKILDSIANTYEMKNLKDSLVSRTFEVSFAINPSGSSFKVIKYDTAGLSYSSLSDISASSIATVHTHPLLYILGYYNQPSHSLPDLFTLIDNFNFRKKCRSSFVISAKDTQQFALHIEDTAKLRIFASNINCSADSLINKTNGYLSWVGYDNDKNTLRGKFLSVKKLFMDKGYLEMDAEYYAQVYMFNTFDLGVGSYKKIEGSFKKLKIKPSINGKDFDIIICND